VSARTLVVVSAGLSTPSSTRLLADRLTASSMEALRRRGADVQVEVVELRDLAHELTDALLTGFPPPRLRAALEAVAQADGVVAVTPVFTASYSGLFKTFFDVLDRTALDGTPVLVGATAGSARHSLVLEHALRPLFSYLRATVAPTAVFAASEDWGTGGPHTGLAERVDRAGAELAALVDARPAAPATPVDEDDDVVPFAQLLESVAR